MKMLIEKLEEKRNWFEKLQNENDEPHAHHHFRGAKRGMDDAIDIVKEHSDWVACSECLPDKFWDDDRHYYCRIVTMGCAKCRELVWRYGEWRNLDFSPLGEKGFTIMTVVTHYYQLPQPPSEVQNG